METLETEAMCSMEVQPAVFSSELFYFTLKKTKAPSGRFCLFRLLHESGILSR